jgi:inosine-uridine nucleoside N-ribohydrolase
VRVAAAAGVVMGQGKPLLRETALLCPEIHGDTGLDGPHGGPVLPHSKRQAIPGKAVIVMFEAIQQQHRQHPQQRVQLVCTGALTNAAMLVLLYPEVKGMIDITIMGGALGVSRS